ncbi:putative Cell division cycle protein 48 [Blattamonas nauphoetae]|uniref:Cell division cycle protein 48 n=1 Tax=Blattamonas nauphoetae TaxID=2049346 RepID=A0ABQ9YEJ1_9EUKA|nr:putative Cell division cycle protein 48 [Blattamonas nauphoetae]
MTNKILSSVVSSGTEFVLLHGDRGTGRTTVIKDFASENYGKNNIFYLDCEIFTKTYIGDYENSLKSIFRQANSQNEKSIIILDNLEFFSPSSLVSQSDEASHDTEMDTDFEERERRAIDLLPERTITSLLCSLLDTQFNINLSCLASSYQQNESKHSSPLNRVLLVGITVSPNLLTPHLLTPTRFSHTILHNSQTSSVRLSLLESICSSFPLKSEERPHILSRIAYRTHGFTASDLDKLAQNALLHWMERTSQNHTQPSKSLDTVQYMSLEDFLIILPTIHSTSSPNYSAVSTASQPTPLSSFFGIDSALSLIKTYLFFPLQHLPLIRRTKISIPSGILITGDTGTGKTALALSCCLSLVNGDGLDTQTTIHHPTPNLLVLNAGILSKTVGDTEKEIHRLFAEARSKSPCLILADNIDTLLPPTEQDRTTTKAFGRIVSAFCEELDECREDFQRWMESEEDESGAAVVVVVSTARRACDIDSRVRSSGRIDTIVKLNKPDETALAEILFDTARNSPLEKLNEVDDTTHSHRPSDEEWKKFFARLVKGELTESDFSSTSDPTSDTRRLNLSLSGWTAAEVKGVVQEAGMHALRRSLDSDCLRRSDFLAAVAQMKMSREQKKG